MKKLDKNLAEIFNDIYTRESSKNSLNNRHKCELFFKIMIESKIPLSRYMFYLFELIKKDSLDKDFLYEIIMDYPDIAINLQQILPKKFKKLIYIIQICISRDLEEKKLPKEFLKEISALVKLYNYDFDKIYSSFFNNEKINII